jgi:hypothetical protein
MNIKCHAVDLPPIHKTQNSLDDYSKKKKIEEKKTCATVTGKIFNKAVSELVPIILERINGSSMWALSTPQKKIK